jgi:hypothetical protein
VPNDEFGDFQTPLALAEQCLRLLDLPPDARILEPTCGTGTFLQAAASLIPHSERAGIEIQPAHAAAASAWGDVRVGNVFTTDISRAAQWQSDGPLYVVGNPPWVTSAELNRMGSDNLPPKENFKGAKGLDAILGSSNFDVCEYIILKALNDCRTERFTLGMLCKTQVARNVIDYAASATLPLVGSALHRIDAMKWFGAGVDACWFVVAVDPDGSRDYTCTIHSDVFSPDAVEGRFGVVDRRMVSDVDRYTSVRQADGSCPYEWRSGLKHDASGVFELVATPSGPATKDGTSLDLESEYVLPFLKSTDIFRARQRELTKWVIVPQLTFGADTKPLQQLAPKLWSYLVKNEEALDGRKSSIYRNRPRFSVFGHGEYTYAPYKVAVSGLHKQPAFRLVSPLASLPVVLDDTCDFLPFDNPTEAAVVTAALNSPQATALIESLVFWDSKRPLTKKLLARIDLNNLPLDFDSTLEAAEKTAAEAETPFDEALASRVLTSFGRDAIDDIPALF